MCSNTCLLSYNENKELPPQKLSPQCARTISALPFYSIQFSAPSLHLLWVPTLLPTSTTPFYPRSTAPATPASNTPLPSPRACALTTAPPGTPPWPYFHRKSFRPLLTPPPSPFSPLCTCLKCSGPFHVYLIAVCLPMRSGARLSWSPLCPQHPAQGRAHSRAQDPGAE